MLPNVGLGTYRSFDVEDTDAERVPLREVLRLFVERGGAMVDSSPMYGRSEAVLGRLASELGIRNKLFLATKVWTQGREYGIRQMETSMRKLRTDWLDLVQVHNLVDWRTHLASLLEWKAQGRIHYIGITHYHSSAYPEIERIMCHEDIDFVQINYSIVDRDAERRLLPVALEREIGVIVNCPFGQGDILNRVNGEPLPQWASELDCRTWAQLLLKFVTSHPAVTCAIPGTRNPRHLMDNMQVAYDRPPDPGTRDKMVRLFSDI